MRDKLWTKDANTFLAHGKLIHSVTDRLVALLSSVILLQYACIISWLETNLFFCCCCRRDTCEMRNSFQ